MIWSIVGIEDKHDVSRGEYCINMNKKAHNAKNYFLKEENNTIDQRNQILLIILRKEFVKSNTNTDKCKTIEIKFIDIECSLEYTNIKDDLILYK